MDGISMLSKQLMNRICKDSLVYRGNSNRLGRALDRVKSGKPLSLVYLGGSITRAMYIKEGYVQFSFQQLKERYGEQVECFNGAMAGTSSVIGMARFEVDVEGKEADVVILEYAVNDAKDSFHREMFESLVYRILQQANHPAIVILLMATECGHSSKGHMQAVGEHYQIPVISVYDGMVTQIASGAMSWKEYSDDTIHPNKEGSKLIADCLLHLFDEVDRGYDVIESRIPVKPIFSRRFSNMGLIDSRSGLEMHYGGFVASSKLYDFVKGWAHATDSNNEPLKLRIYCKSLIVYYTENHHPDYGGAQIKVDGKYMCKMEGFRVFGWDNLQYQFVFQEDVAKEHVIEVSMVDRDKNRFFLLLGLGYCS